MTAKVRKAPTGAKHDRCIGHVEHPYPVKGMLCFGEVIGRDGMIAFADGLAETRAAHRAAFAETVPARPESWYIGSGKTRRLRPIGEHMGHPVVPAVCDGGDGGSRWCRHDASIHAHAMVADVPTLRGRQDDGLAELVARYRAMRGLPAAETPAPVARKRSAVVAPVKPADPLAAVFAGFARDMLDSGRALGILSPAEPVAPVILVPSADIIAAGIAPARRGRRQCPVHGRAGLIACDLCGDPWADASPYALADPVAPADALEPADDLNEVCAEPRCALGTGHTGMHYSGDRERWNTAEPIAETVREPDTYAAAVELAETRPDPCADCGHPAHGATCDDCDEHAQLGEYGPCATAYPAPVQAPERDDRGIAWQGMTQAEYAAARHESLTRPEPIAPPAPVLSAPSTRPTCERCGQLFRVKGVGAEWHRVNRPDCARAAVSV